MNRALAFTIVWIGLLLAPGAAGAQESESNFVPVASADPQAPPGWSFTPALVFGSGYDDNVLVRGAGEPAPGAVLSVLNPRGVLDFNGVHSQLSASYDGAYLLYRDLDQLNSFDQHSSFFGRRMVTRHVAVFVRNSAAAVPTTELEQLVGVPFVRAGSRLEDLRTGVDASFTKRTSLVVSYDFQWVDFDHSAPGTAGLLGGHSQGASLTLRHVLNKWLTLTGDYDLQHATLSGDDQVFGVQAPQVIGVQTVLGVQTAQTFDVQNAWAGGEYRFSEATRLFAEGGVSRLGVTDFSESRTGPAWRLGLVHTVRTAGVDLLYSRSFVPSYGFGGTMQNEELTGRLRLPLGRRVYTTSALSWRRDDPLTPGEVPLRTYWIEGSIGYAATPRVRLEAFYAGTHQSTDLPGGVLDRNRIGFQIIMSKLVRIR